LIIVQAGGVAMKTLGVADAVIIGEAGDEVQAVRKVRSKKEEARWKKESLRMLELFMIWGNEMLSLI
jgi:hypothetical protein